LIFTTVFGCADVALNELLYLFLTYGKNEQWTNGFRIAVVVIDGGNSIGKQ
jgi:hypothetical protein